MTKLVFVVMATLVGQFINTQVYSLNVLGLNGPWQQHAKFCPDLETFRRWPQAVQPECFLQQHIVGCRPIS